MSGSGGRVWLTASVVGVVGVCLVAVGVVVGVLVSAGPVPESLVAEPGGGQVEVGVEVFDGARAVPATVVVDEGAELVVTDAGRVTRSVCEVGEVVASGSWPLSVDDRPVLALATGTPLWRDLGPGDRGEDVRELQAELARLGHTVSVDGVYGAGTRAAVRELQGQAGVVRPSGAIAAASVLWLPAPQVTVTGCQVRTGDRFEGGVWGTTDGGVSQLRIPAHSGGVDHQVTWGEVAAPVHEDGSVTDADLLAAVVGSPELRFALSDTGGGTIDVVYGLAEPVEVLVVPPGALYALVGGSGCVVADGQPRLVQVVASALGQTMVRVEGDAPSTVNLAPHGEPCR